MNADVVDNANYQIRVHFQVVEQLLIINRQID